MKMSRLGPGQILRGKDFVQRVDLYPLKSGAQGSLRLGFFDHWCRCV